MHTKCNHNRCQAPANNLSDLMRMHACRQCLNAASHSFESHLLGTRSLRYFRFIDGTSIRQNIECRAPHAEIDATLSTIDISWGRCSHEKSTTHNTVTAKVKEKNRMQKLQWESLLLLLLHTIHTETEYFRLFAPTLLTVVWLAGWMTA